MEKQQLEQRVKAHYAQPGLIHDILRRLDDLNINPNQLKREDLSGLDEFHVRGSAVSLELAESVNLHQLSVLDVGCGLGGPCRMLADKYDCDTQGIDLNEDYVKAAQQLSEWVGLGRKTKFMVASATSLPFPDHSFDMVWTQHVQMNIPDKELLYAEISRVLKPGGRFLYYDIFKAKEGSITYPMPWAESQELSFLIRPDEMQRHLVDNGMEQVYAKDQTEAGVQFFEGLFSKIKASGPPKLGLNVLMGDSTQTKLTCLMQHLEQRLLRLESGVYLKR
ncbi:MAG: methyltransferase domain-containing protein [Bacteroidota bacterium]